MTGEQWIEAFGQTIGLPTPGQDEVDAILELAATAAHASERTCGVPKLDRALEHGRLPLRRGRSLPALRGPVDCKRKHRFRAASRGSDTRRQRPDRINAPHT
jgi:hypothetical protein